MKTSNIVRVLLISCFTLLFQTSFSQYTDKIRVFTAETKLLNFDKLIAKNDSIKLIDSKGISKSIHSRQVENIKFDKDGKGTINIAYYSFKSIKCKLEKIDNYVSFLLPNGSSRSIEKQYVSSIILNDSSIILPNKILELEGVYEKVWKRIGVTVNIETISRDKFKNISLDSISGGEIFLKINDASTHIKTRQTSSIEFVMEDIIFRSHNSSLNILTKENNWSEIIKINSITDDYIDADYFYNKMVLNEKFNKKSIKAISFIDVNKFFNKYNKDGSIIDEKSLENKFTFTLNLGTGQWYGNNNINLNSFDKLVAETSLNYFFDPNFGIGLVYNLQMENGFKSKADNGEFLNFTAANVCLRFQNKSKKLFLNLKAQPGIIFTKINLNDSGLNDYIYFRTFGMGGYVNPGIMLTENIAIELNMGFLFGKTKDFYYKKDKYKLLDEISFNRLELKAGIVFFF